MLQEIHAKQQLSKSRAAGLGDDEYEGFLELHAMLPKKKGRFSDQQASSDGCFQQVSGLQSCTPLAQLGSYQGFSDPPVVRYSSIDLRAML